MADEKLKTAVQNFLRDSFKSEEQARGYYSKGQFDYLQNALAEDGREQDALRYFYYFTAVGQFATNLMNYSAFVEPNVAMKFGKILTKYERLDMQLHDLVDGTIPEGRAIAGIKTNKNVFSEIADMMLKIQAEEPRVMAQAVKFIPTINDDIQRFAKGLRHMQAEFDATIGAVIEPAKEMPLTLNTRKLQGEALLFLNGKFQPNLSLDTLYGEPIADNMRKSGEALDEPLTFKFFHGVNQRQMGILPLFLNDLKEEELTKDLATAFNKVEQSLSGIDIFQRTGEGFEYLLPVRKAFADLAEVTKKVHAKLSPFGNHIEDMWEKGELWSLGNSAHNYQSPREAANVVRSVLERLPGISAGYEAIQAKYDQTLGRQINAAAERAPWN